MRRVLRALLRGCEDLVFVVFLLRNRLHSLNIGQRTPNHTMGLGLACFLAAGIASHRSQPRARCLLLTKCSRNAAMKKAAGCNWLLHNVPKRQGFSSNVNPGWSLTQTISLRGVDTTNSDKSIFKRDTLRPQLLTISWLRLSHCRWVSFRDCDKTWQI